MRMWVVGVALLTVGCSGDPESSVLGRGRAAVVSPGSQVILTPPNRAPVVFLEPGTPVEVDVDRPPSDPSSAMAKMRQVEVTIRAGEHRGTTGSVPRYRLRPE